MRTARADSSARTFIREHWYYYVGSLGTNKQAIERPWKCRSPNFSEKKIVFFHSNTRKRLTNKYCAQQFCQTEHSRGISTWLHKIESRPVGNSNSSSTRVGERSYGFQVSWQGVGFIHRAVWLLENTRVVQKSSRTRRKEAIAFEF